MDGTYHARDSIPITLRCWDSLAATKAEFPDLERLFQNTRAWGVVLAVIFDHRHKRQSAHQVLAVGRTIGDAAGGCGFRGGKLALARITNHTKKYVRGRLEGLQESLIAGQLQLARPAKVLALAAQRPQKTNSTASKAQASLPLPGRRRLSRPLTCLKPPAVSELSQAATSVRLLAARQGRPLLQP